MSHEQSDTPDIAQSNSASSESAAGESAAGNAAATVNTPAEGAAASSSEGGSTEARAAEAAPVEGGDEGEDGEETDAEGASEGEAGKEAASADGVAKKKRRRKRKKKKPEGAAAHAPGSEGEPRESTRPHRASERAPFHVGEEVFGKVTAVIDTAIMVDLSGKALAIFDRSEMEPDDLVPVPGERFVARVHNDGTRGGLVVLTRKPLREEETKAKLEAAFKNGELVSGLITGVIKGGVEVDIGGIRAFAPASGMDLHPGQANFTTLLGQRMDFKLVSVDKSGREVVVTRRPMLEAEAHERRKRALSLLTEGQVLPGVVRTVVEWGAFVALPEAENLEGLVHVSEVSHDPRAPITELVKPGDRFEVKIIKIDEKGKIWLSRKALVDDPWASARRKFEVRSRHTGKVTRLEKFGAFVELEPGIEGLLHVADLSLERVEHPNLVLKEGQDLEVLVHHFDPRSKKITLHPAPPADRPEEAPQKILRNALIKAEVVKGEAAGVVVRVLGVTGRAARGFIPAGQTGTNRGTDLRKAFKPGSVIDVKVLDIDPRSGEPKLSIRGFKEDEERRAHNEYRQKLKEEGGFGTLGDLLKNKLRAGEEREV
ncbi:MAG TPA: S1 RNA-binding domain-containing protein [Polyangiaceae bacterium]|nr:S1 RNA-binding domain-containing protein [Polyangiaceae bacterium]